MTPLWADYKPSATKDAARPASSKNLKWRTPKSDSQQSADEPMAKSTANVVAEKREQAADDRQAKSKPSAVGEDQQQTEATPASAKSVLKMSVSGSPAKANSAPAEPEQLGEVPAAKPIAASGAKRSRGAVERLSDAGPSPHSIGAADDGGSSLKILKTSNEEPKIDPFGDDFPAIRPAKTPARQRAVRAGLQERRGGAAPDPFGDEPRLERGPSSQPPERLEPDELTQAPNSLPYTCPTPKEYVKKLSDISTNIAAEPGEFPTECGLGDEEFAPRNWQSTLFAWKASALCHKPLYFEDVELERYGQTCSPLFQPIMSATKFYLALPILPYMMGLEPPCECIYPLGYYRPGSCAPFIIPPVPISLRGAMLEAGVWVAGVALVP